MKTMKALLLLFSSQSVLAWSPFSTVLSPESKTSFNKSGTLDKVQRIQKEKEMEARSRHKNDVLNALLVSVPERPEPTLIHDVGSRPKDFPPGAFLRLGPNGATKEEGFLDGDGLLHCVTIPPHPDAPLIYSSAYIETEGRKLEKEKNGRFVGTLGAAPDGFPLLVSVVKNMIKFQMGTKDTCNTALAEHGGRILSLMEQAPPSEVEIRRDGSIKTVKAKTNLDGGIPANDPITGGTFSAHGKTCPDTGDRIHVSYASSAPPFARVDIFEEGWKLKKTIPVHDLPCPVMIHDCAITKNYAMILDFPLTLRPLRMLKNRFPVEYEPENGARIGLVPRNGDGKTQWFDCKPGVILHTVNAYETSDDKVVLHALRSEPTGEGSYITTYTTSFLYEWVLDIKTGKVISEECLNPEELVEFPIIDDRFTSNVAEACYAVGVLSIGGPLKVCKNPGEGLLLNRVVKFALTDNQVTGRKKGDVIGRFTLPKDWYGVTEPTIVPKEGDGKGSVYMIVTATKVPDIVPSENCIANKNVLDSRVFVVDGDNLDSGAVWEFDLPYHLPYGLHSAFLDWDKMK